MSPRDVSTIAARVGDSREVSRLMKTTRLHYNALRRSVPDEDRTAPPT